MKVVSVITDTYIQIGLGKKIDKTPTCIQINTQLPHKKQKTLYTVKTGNTKKINLCRT